MWIKLSRSGKIEEPCSRKQGVLGRCQGDYGGAGLFERFSSISWRDALRAAWQAGQQVPGLGLPLMVPLRGHIFAVRDAAFTILCGSIGLWLAPSIIAMSKSPHMAVAPVLVLIGRASVRGDALILVPSLVAPAFLLIFTLKNNPRFRNHQVALLFGAAAVAAFAVLVYVTKVASTVADSSFLAGASKAGVLLSCAALYLYFLLEYVPQDLLKQFSVESSSLINDVAELRKKEGR